MLHLRLDFVTAPRICAVGSTSDGLIARRIRGQT